MIKAGVCQNLLAGALLLLGALPARAVSIEYGTIGGPTAAAWPLLIASAKGLYAAAGLSVDFVYAPSSAAVAQQVAAGSEPIGDGGLNDPIRAAFEGAPVAIVRIEGTVPPYALDAKPELRSLKDLRGKTIMVGGAKDITLTYLRAMLEPNGLGPDDYSLVFAGATVARASALQTGAVDAAMLLPPFSFHVEDAGFRNLGLVDDYVKTPFTAMIVNRAWASGNKDTLETFLRVFNQATDWFLDDKNRAEAIAILVAASHLAPADSEKSYDFYRRIHFFERSDAVSKKGVEAVIDTIRSDFGGKKLSVDALFLPGVTHVTE